ncbi:spondin domain-containing protein [Winogradskyella sp. R77965]|uniref:spondin domain-containing protein n=1 Tax=Winogradskyella sp. R77965 TaxID=3093872 RepID=UPI0037DC2227
MKKITLTLILVLALLHTVWLSAQSTATYDINFTSTWNSTDHGTVPGNAHWSDLVGVNHNSNVTFLEMGGVATLGVENIAETGAGGEFGAEVQTAVNAGNAQQYLNQSFSPFAAISSATFSNVTVSEDYPLLTLLSMIAPSPDWMIAVNSLSLWDTSMNKWKETFTIDLFPYDAGTEDGFGYSQENPETVPRGVITNIAGAAGYPFNTSKIGTLTVTFKSTTLNIKDIEALNSITLFPNPNNTGSVTISNSNDINSIEVYDVLGKNIKKLSFATTRDEQHLDTTDLTKGIYIIRLTNTSGNTESKKLIIN